MTQWGDTLRFPYWTSYIIHLPDTVSPVLFSVQLAQNFYHQLIVVQPVLTGSMHETQGTPNDPLYIEQRSLFTPLSPPLSLTDTAIGINVEKAWDYTTGINAVRMATLDAGFDTAHTDFKHIPFGGGAPQKNIAFLKNYTPSGSANDGDRHGLFVSGIMGALRNNKNSANQNVGIAGVAGGDWSNGTPGPRLYLGKVIPTYVRHHGDALDELTSAAGCNERVRVFNMSYASFSFMTIGRAGGRFEEYQSLARAYRRCAVMVNAKQHTTYNKSTDVIPGQWEYDLPSGYNDQWIIGVGASRGRDGYLATNSSWGGNMRLIAPGGWGHVYSLTNRESIYGYGYDVGDYIPGTDRDARSATSWAAPHVSGTAALILSRDTTLLNDDVAGLMEATTRNTGYFRGQVAVTDSAVTQTTLYDKHTGFGLLDAGEAVAAVPNVQRGFVELGKLSTEEYHARVTRIDDDSFSRDVMVRPTELTDAFPREHPDTSYRWQRLRLIVDVTVGTGADMLCHAWGIGMGHGFVPNTTGWEPGPVFRPHVAPATPIRWCSETPYAKVPPDSINQMARTFSVETYIYRVQAVHRTTFDVAPPSYYPVHPRDAILSYGYILAPCVRVVETAAPATAFAMVNIRPNPVAAHGEATLRFATNEPGEYSVAVYDLMGRLAVESRSLGEIEAATHDVPLSLRGLAPGTYFCRITSLVSGRSIGQSLIITR